MKIMELIYTMKPHKVYAVNPDPKAMNQFYEAMKQDSVVQGAVMPDVHHGYALPIGAVVATEGMIYPAWVGYDIGCGMMAMPTTFEREDVEGHKGEIWQKVFESIPVGLGVYNDKPKYSLKSDVNFNHEMGSCSETFVKLYEEKDGDRQLGSLGSGNHFIEIGYDERDVIWIIVHSGSRGVGHAVASHYMKAAAGNRYVEGNFGFRTDSDIGNDYICDMNYCLAFAWRNRYMIAGGVVSVMRKILDSGEIDYPNVINKNHNHATKRGDIWIHRKGATHAEDGMPGVIPGNMRDGSFIVEGKGNPDSLWSSAHGAGRVMSRSQAKKSISMDTFRSQMDGIAARVDEKVIDEAPDAYKDIEGVMELQKDLVSVVHRVRPIINIKG